MASCRRRRGNAATFMRRMQHEFGLTLLLVEQQLPFGVHTGDRYCLLEGGRNVAQGALDEQDNAADPRLSGALN